MLTQHTPQNRVIDTITHPTLITTNGINRDEFQSLFGNVLLGSLKSFFQLDDKSILAFV